MQFQLYWNSCSDIQLFCHNTIVTFKSENVGLDDGCSDGWQVGDIVDWPGGRPEGWGPHNFINKIKVQNLDLLVHIRV